MTKASKIFKNDVGVQFRIYADVDISTATSIIIKVKKPDSSIASWTASYDTDNPRYATYTTVTSDLNLDGQWLASLYVTFSDGTILTGESAPFEVFNQFDDITL